MLSCTENKSTILETPFVTVVKLVSAEQSLAFEEAIQYIDVIQVYSKLGLENPENFNTISVKTKKSQTILNIMTIT